MPNGQSLHDRLLQALLQASKVNDVLLAARLEDPRIGNEDAKGVRVFIPDLHLLTGKDEKRFPYGFNCKDQMIGLLKAFKLFRKGLADDENLIVYQLGDFVDLWRQGSDDPTKILEENYDIYGHLSEGSSALNAWFLLGNHDIDLPNGGGFRIWNRRYYFPIRDPKALVVHGDIFDMLERLPDWFQRLFVYMFGPMYDGTAYDLDNLQKAVKQAQGRKQYPKTIQGEYHDIAGCVSAANRIPGDSYFNVTKVTDPRNKEGHEFLPAAYESVQKVKTEFNLNLKIAIIGHTHHARIAVYEGGNGEFFALMDCGAWIEKYRTTADQEPKPSAQIGVIVGNDCRIYQIV